MLTNAAGKKHLITGTFREENECVCLKERERERKKVYGTVIYTKHQPKVVVFNGLVTSTLLAHSRKNMEDVKTAGLLLLVSSIRKQHIKKFSFKTLSSVIQHCKYSAYLRFSNTVDMG